MKKSFIMLALCLLNIAVNAQSKHADLTMPPTVIMPDGSIVPIKSMDSIRKVFGGREVSFSLHDDGTVSVHPVKNKAEQLDSDAKLNSHLHKPAPQFAFNDMDGRLYSLSSLKGKTVVLNFWFTSCASCIMEMPDLNRLKQSYIGKNVVFLAITYDNNAKVKAFLTKHKFEYAILPNAKKACDDYDLIEYPTSIVIDRNGIVKFISSSVNTDIKSELSKAIDEVRN